MALASLGSNPGLEGGFPKKCTDKWPIIGIGRLLAVLLTIGVS